MAPLPRCNQRTLSSTRIETITYGSGLPGGTGHLGLVGQKVRTKDYADALGDYLGISINIHVILDDWYPELSRRLAISGRLGELRYSEQLTLAAIFVPGSLPPLVSTLSRRQIS